MSPSLKVNARVPVTNAWLYSRVNSGVAVFSCAWYTSAGSPSGPALFPEPMLLMAYGQYCFLVSSTSMDPSKRRRRSRSLSGRWNSGFIGRGSYERER